MGQKGTGREGGWKEGREEGKVDGYDNCKVSGGPDIPCPPSHPQHTDTHGLSKANAELQRRRAGEKKEESSQNKKG